MNEQSDRLLEKLFPETSGPKTVIPFPSAKALKRGPPLVNNGWVVDAFEARSNGDVELVDPACLHATQPWVTKPGVAYYLTDEYALTGETFADKHSPLNRFPVIYVRSDGEARILSGHHRSTAALLKGEKVHAIVVRDPWLGSRSSARLITPTLLVGNVAETDTVSARPVDSVEEATRAIRSGERVAVPTSETAAEVLVALGVDSETAIYRATRP